MLHGRAMNSTLERKLVQRVSHSIYYLCTEGTWAWEVLQFVHSLFYYYSLTSQDQLHFFPGHQAWILHHTLLVACYIRAILSFSQYTYWQIIVCYMDRVKCSCSETKLNETILTNNWCITSELLINKCEHLPLHPMFQPWS